jgi:hypothetical protein
MLRAAERISRATWTSGSSSVTGDEAWARWRTRGSFAPAAASR